MTRSLGLLVLGALTVLQGACAPGKPGPDKPPIVEVFACSDYCPGPEEQYLKKVYEGIEDPESCEEVGGKPYVYFGWGSFFVCLAD